MWGWRFTVSWKWLVSGSVVTCFRYGPGFHPEGQSKARGRDCQDNLPRFETGICWIKSTCTTDVHTCSVTIVFQYPHKNWVPVLRHFISFNVGYEFGPWWWAASVVEDVQILRQMLHLPSSVWMSVGGYGTLTQIWQWELSVTWVMWLDEQRSWCYKKNKRNDKNCPLCFNDTLSTLVLWCRIGYTRIIMNWGGWERKLFWPI
jgi:hypothetical protein